MRMLPIGPLFGRFHRVIRDLTRANGKDIRLADQRREHRAGQADDRRAGRSDDPSHPQCRRPRHRVAGGPPAAGKPRQGTISLSAFHRGSNIMIRVSDDGRGLGRRADPGEGRRDGPALGRRRPAAGPAADLAADLAAGLEHRGESDRGLGPRRGHGHRPLEDRGAQRLVELDSEPGRGTTFTIKLPLTLAILPSLMVEIDGDVFAVPLESVVEIVSVGREEIHTVQGCPMASVRRPRRTACWPWAESSIGGGKPSSRPRTSAMPSAW